MKFERIRSVDYYCCPACGMAFTDRKEAERHFRYDHQIEICKVIRCNICGTGWDTKVYGEQEARRRADQCYQSHIDDGSAEAIAIGTDLLSKIKYCPCCGRKIKFIGEDQ